MIDRFYSLDAIKARLKKILGADAALAKEIEELSFEELREVWQKHYREGIHMASPVFDGATEDEVREFLAEAGLPTGGQARLRDGRSGEDNAVADILRGAVTIDEAIESLLTRPFKAEG